MSAVAVQSVPPRSQSKPGPRRGINRRSSLTQAMDLQAVAFAAAHDPAVPAHIKAALMRAWVDLEEVRLTLKGHGKPKPVEAKNAKPKTRPRASSPIAFAHPIEPLTQQPAPPPPANVTPPESG